MLGQFWTISVVVEENVLSSMKSVFDVTSFDELHVCKDRNEMSSNFVVPYDMSLEHDIM